MENGCVWVLPGSHKDGLVPHKPSPIGLICHDSDAPDQCIPVPVTAGSIAAFWSLTMHKSGVNRSQGIRKAYIIQYSKAPLARLADSAPIENQIKLTRNNIPVVADSTG